MTKDQPTTAADDELPVITTREKRTARERLTGRTCEWCGEWVPYDGRGRPRRFCSDAHRQRAYEVRTAQARQERDAAAGRVREEPVREVVERTELVTRTVVRRGRTRVQVVPARTAQEWAQALRLLAADAAAGRIPPGWAESLARACEATARELRETAGIRQPTTPSTPTSSTVPPSRRERRKAAKGRKKRRR